VWTAASCKPWPGLACAVAPAYDSRSTIQDLGRHSCVRIPEVVMSALGTDQRQTTGPSDLGLCLPASLRTGPRGIDDGDGGT
jgi:hypothetical protein